MRKESKINGRINYLLNRESLIWIELLPCAISISGRVKKFDDLSITHKSEFSMML